MFKISNSIVYESYEGQTFTIIESVDYKHNTIQFEDGTILKNIPYNRIETGTIKNPYKPTVCGVGYFGEGKYTTLNSKKAYSTWSNMLRKCYKIENIDFGKYTVCKEWRNFQVFAKWFYKNCKNIDKVLKPTDYEINPKTFKFKELC